MRIDLVTPPHYHLANTLAVPRLTAYLRSKGIDIRQQDIDMQIYDHLLSRQHLDAAFDRIEQMILPILDDKYRLAKQIKAVWQQFSNFIKGRWGRYMHWRDVVADRHHVMNLVEDNLNVLHTHFMQLPPDEFQQRYDDLSAAMLLFSLAYAPTIWTPLEGISMTYSPYKSRDIIRAVADEDQNFLIFYYETSVMPQLIERQPAVVGISMNHFSQLIPGFTLASLIRRQLPQCHITLGGMALSNISRFFGPDNPLWYLFDSLVVGVGEYALERLISTLADGHSLATVPNLLFRHGRDVIRTTVQVNINMNDFETPEFTENRPNPIIPLAASMGCNYAGCRFCHYPYIHSGDITNSRSYAKRSMNKVIKDLTILTNKYQPLFFLFTDTNVTPRWLDQLTDNIQANHLNVRLFAFTRAEKKFESLNFCKKLAKGGFIGGYLGLESGCEATNKRMNKGLLVSGVQKVIENFSKADIIVSLFCMVGFPGETEQEAWMTYEFLEKNLNRIQGELSLSYFHLKWNTPVFKNPDTYHITNISHANGVDLISRYNYEVNYGLTQTQAKKFAKKFNKMLGLSYVSNKFALAVMQRLWSKD